MNNYLYDSSRGTIDWSQQTVLVTGGTGFFGKTFCEMLLRDCKPRKLIIFSRDELKQQEMRQKSFGKNVEFLLGDVRDSVRVRRIMAGIDIVVHAAALKQVDTCEYQPSEAVLTNVAGSHNIVESAMEAGVGRVIVISTDKAVNPVNLYGATKLISEKLFVQANADRRRRSTRLSGVRYGNVVGSRGSVIPLFVKQRDAGVLTVTDLRMTRFWLTIEQGARFVRRCIEQMHGGEVFVPRIPSVHIHDLARTIAPAATINCIGIRPGEKIHEVLVSSDESSRTIEFEDMYVVTPAQEWWSRENWSSGRPVEDGFQYSSDRNDLWLCGEELRRMLKEYLPAAPHQATAGPVARSCEQPVAAVAHGTTY